MPLFRPHIETPSYSLGIWNIDESIDKLMSSVNKAGFKTLSLRSYKSELKQRQWLAARMLLRDMLPNSEDIFYDEIGAPFLKTGPKISMTHSDKRVALLISKNAEVGVDIQEFSEKIYRVKEKFCNSE